GLFKGCAVFEKVDEPPVSAELPEGVEEVGIIFKHPLKEGEHRGGPRFFRKGLQKCLSSLLDHIGGKDKGRIDCLVEPFPVLLHGRPLEEKGLEEIAGEKGLRPLRQRCPLRLQEVDVLGLPDTILDGRKKTVEAPCLLGLLA